MDPWIPTLLSGLQSMTIMTYFDAQVVPDLASGSSFKLASVPAILLAHSDLWHKMVQVSLPAPALDVAVWLRTPGSF